MPARPNRMSDNAIVIAFFGAIALATVAFAYGGGIIRDFRDRQVLSDGLPAEARVLGLEQTGNFFNNMPEMRIRLDVTPGSGPSFTAEVVRVVGTADLPRFMPGQSLSVRYQPGPPPRVALMP